MSAFWFITFAAFILMIKPEFIRTFFTTMTAKQQLQRIFLDSNDDKEKMSVFKKHRSYRKEIEREVREFVSQNYFKWEHENRSGGTRQ